MKKIIKIFVMGLKVATQFHLTCLEKVVIRSIKDSQKKKMAKEKILFAKHEVSKGK